MLSERSADGVSGLDYVRVDKATDVVKAFPDLGLVDASASAANTVAAPLLSIAGEATPPYYSCKLHCAHYSTYRTNRALH